MNDFVVYVEVLKANLDEFTSIQQKNHLVNRLKKKIKEKFNAITNMFQTRETLIALTQRIKNSQSFKNDQKNKIHNDRNLQNKNNFNLRKKHDNRVEDAKKRTKQQNQFNNENRRNKIIRLFLRIANETSDDSKNDKNCYNYEKKKHIAKNCLEFKQNNSQVNVIKNFRQSTQQNEQKTFSLQTIIEISNDSKN